MSDNDTEIHHRNNDQRKNNCWTIRWYFLLLCLIVLCQSMITSGYISAIVSSIETYYGFSSERLGIAFSSYDITGIVSIPLISFIGSKYNRAKIVACGSFLFSMGNIIFILPYLINGYRKQMMGNSTNETSTYLCLPNSTNHTEYFSFVSNNDNSLIEIQPIWTYYMIILSMIIMSIGASPFYTLGITYLTDHLKKNDQPIYTSLLYGMVALGPAIGFLLGSLFVSEWINIGEYINDDSIRKTDPQWIGRWWAGFILSSILLLVLSFILFTFPSQLKQNDNEIIESNQSLEESYENRCLWRLSAIKEILNSICDLMKNLTYILMVLINSIENILIVSFTTFMVKYIESVFNISSSLSSILTGSIIIPGAVFGTITGGYLIRRFQMNIYESIKFIFLCCFMSLVFLFSLLFIKCKSNIKYSIDQKCSQYCNCSPNIYQPVCFQQELTYLSPCYAGCTNYNGKEYVNCTCLSNDDKLTEGLCQNSCQYELILFFVILFLITYFETLMATPHLIIILRSVRHELQSFSLGLENCFVKIIAQIPTPILFGIILDNQCLFWSESISHRRASCFIYNGDKLPLTLFSTTISIKLISFILILILFLIKFRENKFLLVQQQERQEEQQDLLNNPHS